MPPRGDALAQWLAGQSAVAKLFAHDFKNPISALAANLSYLQLSLADAAGEIRESIDDSVFSVGALMHLIDNYVLIARLEAGEHVEPIPVPLVQLVDSALRASRDVISAGQVELRIDGPVPDAMCVLEVPTASAVLKNLLVGSATQAMGGGEVALRVTAGEGRVRFSACDTGPLVDEAYRGELLTREFQCRSKSLPGSRYARGLGLYIVGLGAAFLGGEAAVGVRDGRSELTVILPSGDGAAPPAGRDRGGSAPANR
jgi:signal transduction histidine kinase